MFAAGTSGMMQTFGEKSTQNYLVVYWEESQEAGSIIRLMEEDGTVLGEYGPEKAFDTAIISVPGLEEGRKYRVRTGEKEEDEKEIEVTGGETVLGTARGGREGGKRPEDRRWPEEDRESERGERRINPQRDATKFPPEGPHLSPDE